MEAEYDFSQGKRGVIQPIAAGKTPITIRLDDDVLVVSETGSCSRRRQLSKLD
jgi:hypothetical protein